ncbi:glycosyltransferase family 4 protein [Thermaurantimonas aggregans]|uniref:glycosyltransferase family 4 protein n=1 Tax=Thermaurantimonas aggregans TaxID=2173829 RepID=UPI001357FDBD|nr:glycosyltransferase family 4 protein [Thermaurantimonas aggregans]
MGFYYHIPAVITENQIKLPGFLGVFISALAKEVDSLVLILHQADKHYEQFCDYELISKNITVINLGYKTPAWHREFFHKKILKTALRQAEICDAIIIRSPTPLAAYFHKYVKHPELWFLIVGDYLEGTEHYLKSGLRNKLIYFYLKVNNYFFQKRIPFTNVLVNSPALLKKYTPVAKRIHLIKSTTLNEIDLYYREDTCQNNRTNILFTGRFAYNKGLVELFEALNKLILIKEKDFYLHLAGWEDDVNKPVENKLRELAEKLKITDRVIFHGRKKVGTDLNAMYRSCDIYVLPSYHEGFPRTIWEAMANSLPVIATSVGGIPEYLEHETHALLIPPKNVEALVEAIKRIINDKGLRKKLIYNGFELAKSTTLEIQTKKLVQIIKQQFP